MKYKEALYILFAIIPFYLNSQTELAIYGFKGRVKTVYYYIYNEAEFDKDGLFIDEKKQPYIEKALHFDKKGNLDSIVEVLSEGRFYEKYLTRYVHAGNRVKSTVKYRYYTNELMDEVKYSWSEKNLKCSFKGVGLTTFTKGFRKLTYNFRETSGEYEQETKKGEVLLKESYKNEFDSYLNLVKTHYYNALKGNYTILYEYEDRDDVGNFTTVKLTYEKTKKLQRFIKKEFVYY